MPRLISVIVPVFNHANVIEKSLRSLALQTYRPFEVIVVNDGSTDNFKEKCQYLEKIADSYHFKIQIINQENQGAPAARNRGFNMAQGEFVIFWDADTIAKPIMLQHLCEALDNYPEASYAYSQFRFGWKKMRSQYFNGDDLRKYNYIDTTSLIRREDFCEFDTNLKRFQDWDLWLTLLENKKKGVFVPEVLFRKIVTRSGISGGWLGAFLSYQFFRKNNRSRAYLEARKIIQTKHSLLKS